MNAPVTYKPPPAISKLGIGSPARVLTIAIAACGLFLVWLLPLEDMPTLCFTRQITGVPCPTCGTGRSLHALLRGRVLDSWHFHPLVIVFLAGYGILCITDRWLTKKDGSVFRGVRLWIILGVSGVLMMAVWAVRLRLGAIH